MAQRKKVEETNAASPITKIELLITIVNRSKVEYFTDMIQEFECNSQLVLMGEGTANTELLKKLGINSNEKAVILSIINEKKTNSVLEMIEDRFNTVRNGKGVAFVVPIDSVIGVALYAFLSNNKLMVKEAN